VVELRYKLSARPVPELEYRRHKPDSRHIRRERIFREQFKSSRMGGRSARVCLQPGIVVEQPHAHSAPAEQPGAKQPDRPPTGNQHQVAIVFHCAALA
jgi:hypothetical protein